MTDFHEGAESVPRYYPYITRSIIELFEAGELSNVIGLTVEPDYGYATWLTYVDGSVRTTYGNDLGLNTGAAADIAKDKGHTKFRLRSIGVACPEGDEFLLPWWAGKMRESKFLRTNPAIKTTDQAKDYIDSTFGYPVYVKPVDGSKGADIFKVHEPEELDAIFQGYAEKRVRVAMVEEPVNMPDYRIVVLDGELISAYRRDPLAVVGDGMTDIRGLLSKLQETFVEQGRDTRINADDPRISNYLASQRLDMDYIPSGGHQIILAPISNLSTGGTSADVTDRIARRWSELAALIADKFGLRLCGLDLACEDITDSDAAYSVLEVNASPGLDHYAQAGEAQARVVRSLYAKVLNTLPSPAPVRNSRGDT